MFQDNVSNIQNINITEVSGGAVVELVLADASQLDDAEESLVLSLRIEYEGDYPFLEQIKKSALVRARSVISNEVKRIQAGENKYTL